MTWSDNSQFPSEDDLFEVYDDSPVIKPASSRLFCRSEKEARQFEDESLTSYIKRLAHEHHLSPRDLIKYEIVPMLDMNYVNKGSGFYKSGAHTLNGSGETTARFVNAMEQLSLTRDLDRHTFLPWRYITSRKSHGLTRPLFHWCPECYEDQRQQGKSIYEKLSWCIHNVIVCPIHHKLLASTCPHCNSEQPYISHRSKLGYCNNCFGWLGLRRSEDMFNVHNYSAEARFAFDVELLISYGRFINYYPVRKELIDRIQSAIDRLAGGDVHVFAREYAKVDYVTISQWLRGRYLPRFDSLVHLCRNIGTSLGEFLYEKDPKNIFYKRNSIDSKWISNKAIRGDDARYNRTKIYLKQVLEDGDSYNSLKEVAHELKTSIGYLKHHFNSECRAISQRYMLKQEDDAAKNKSARQRKVKEIVHMLHENGQYPSQNRVSQFLKSKAYFKNADVREAYFEALKELGVR